MNILGQKMLGTVAQKLGVTALRSMALAVAGKTDWVKIRQKQNNFKKKSKRNRRVKGRKNFKQKQVYNGKVQGFRELENGWYLDLGPDKGKNYDELELLKFSKSTYIEKNRGVELYGREYFGLPLED